MYAPHDLLVATLAHLPLKIEFTDGDSDYDELASSLVIQPGEIDRNIEVIYANDAVLLQENGNDVPNGRRTFVWWNSEWAEKVREIIESWLAK